MWALRKRGEDQVILLYSSFSNTIEVNLVFVASLVEALGGHPAAAATAVLPESGLGVGLAPLQEGCLSFPNVLLLPTPYLERTLL